MPSKSGNVSGLKLLASGNASRMCPKKSLPVSQQHVLRAFRIFACQSIIQSKSPLHNRVAEYFEYEYLYFGLVHNDN